MRFPLCWRHYSFHCGAILLANSLYHFCSTLRLWWWWWRWQHRWIRGWWRGWSSQRYRARTCTFLIEQSLRTRTAHSSTRLSPFFFKLFFRTCSFKYLHVPLKPSRLTSTGYFNITPGTGATYMIVVGGRVGTMYGCNAVQVVVPANAAAVATGRYASG